MFCPYEKEFMKLQKQILEHNVTAQQIYHNEATIIDAYIDLINDYGGMIRQVDCLHRCGNAVEKCSIFKTICKEWFFKKPR